MFTPVESIDFCHVVYERLIIHFDRHGIIPACQHGFRKNRSVTTQLLETFEDYSSAVESKQWIDTIFIDLAKAFDSVPHARLLTKLESVGITGTLLKWIESYLKDRSFHVIVKGELSESQPVKSGVPQGSILGPLLFLLYIHDLPDFCNTQGVSIKLFADDLKAYHISNSKNIHFTKPLKTFIAKVLDYCNRNGLQINAKKCSIMHLGKGNPELPYTMESAQIPALEPDNSVRDLGVHFSVDLKWEKHISNIVLKSRRASFAIFKSLKSNNANTMVQLFCTFVRPILEFSSSVFNPYYDKDIRAIEKVQKDFLRTIFKRTNFGMEVPHYEDLLKHYDIMSLEKRRLKADFILFHKYMTGVIPLPPNLTAFSCVQSKTRGELYKFKTTAATSFVRFNSFFVRVSKLYSNLPLFIRQLCMKDFTNQIQNFI